MADREAANAAPVTLHIEEQGSGDPAIVFVHGFAGSARNFRPQARHFRARHRVVLFDLRGHARSGAPTDPAEYTPERFVDDVGRVLREARVDRPVLAGISLGASIALRYALAHGDSLRGLVLASFPAAASDGAATWATRFADTIEREGLEAAGAEFVWGGGRFDDAARRFIRQGFLEHAPHALIATLRNVLAKQPSIASLADDLARAEIPTLVVVGEKDAPSIAPSTELARLMPSAELVTIPGAGHVVNLEKPESFDGALDDFLRRIEP
jgi:3-oxoadipate enol-lactonase